MIKFWIMVALSPLLARAAYSDNFGGKCPLGLAPRIDGVCVKPLVRKSLFFFDYPDSSPKWQPHRRRQQQQQQQQKKKFLPPWQASTIVKGSVIRIPGYKPSRRYNGRPGATRSRIHYARPSYDRVNHFVNYNFRNEVERFIDFVNSKYNY